MCNMRVLEVRAPMGLRYELRFLRASLATSGIHLTSFETGAGNYGGSYGNQASVGYGVVKTVSEYRTETPLSAEPFLTSSKGTISRPPAPPQGGQQNDFSQQEGDLAADSNAGGSYGGSYNAYGQQQ